MKAFRIVNSLNEPILEIPFSTRERAERELLDDELGEEDGYFIQESELSDEEYQKLVAWEAEQDDDQDRFLLGEYQKDEKVRDQASRALAEAVQRARADKAKKND